jgi:hypothetical protein
VKDFFTGLHHLSDAQHFERCFVSVNAIRRRKSAFQVGRRNKGQLIIDCAGFTEMEIHGGYRHPVSEYAGELRKARGWLGERLIAAISQDYMCEPRMLARTGLTIPDHQRLTIERYDELVAERTGVLIIPVLQGYAPGDYVSHVRQYGARLKAGAWVGVGSVCKRNGDPAAIEAVLEAIHAERPDLKLHGFGIKKTALKSRRVRELLHTADSMAWSYSARKQGRDANDWREADRFTAHINHLITGLPQQIRMLAEALWLEVRHV